MTGPFSFWHGLSDVVTGVIFFANKKLSFLFFENDCFCGWPLL